jgi:hypothetical protein
MRMRSVAATLAFFCIFCSREGFDRELNRTTTAVEGRGEALTYASKADELAIVYSILESPEAIARGQEDRIRFRVKNAGNQSWPAATELPLKFSYHWYAPDPGAWRLVSWDDAKRVHLPSDLSPGESAELLLEIKAPSEEGTYKLVLSPLFEGTPQGNWATDLARQRILTIQVR